MKSVVLSLLLLVISAGGCFAQSGTVVPSVTRNPSHSTYSPAGGRIGFNVTLTYPVGSIPSFQVKPPGADWLFVGVGGPDLPLTPNLPGDSTNPAAYDSGFDFYYTSPPESGTARFSFVISYPPGLSSNPTIVFRANYQQNGVKTIAVDDLTLTPQNTAPDPVVVWLPPSLVKAGDKASFPLLFAGVAPYSLQWIKGGSDITNATGESYEINKVGAADAVTYAVRITAGGRIVTSQSVGLSVLTHSSPISPGGKLTITGVNLPATGTATVAVDGNKLTNPILGTQSIVADVPSTLTVGANPLGVDLSIADLGAVSYSAGYHTADTKSPRWSLDLAELLRVIGFFNTKHTATDGSVSQTGCYKVDPANTIDGFAVDTARSAPAGALSRYHSADTNRDGAISLSELLRVIGFFNTRNTGSDGTVRQTGFYRIQFGTADGFVTDPSRAP